MWLQDCPEDHKCVPYASSGGTWDAFKCVPILGERKPGATCTSTGKVEATDDRGPGLVCWEMSESGGELAGKCAPLCTGDANAPQCGMKFFEESVHPGKYTDGVCLVPDN